jgi:hypothetical protein
MATINENTILRCPERLANEVEAPQKINNPIAELNCMFNDPKNHMEQILRIYGEPFLTREQQIASYSRVFVDEILSEFDLSITTSDNSFHLNKCETESNASENSDHIYGNFSNHSSELYGHFWLPSSCSSPKSVGVKLWEYEHIYDDYDYQRKPYIYRPHHYENIFGDVVIMSKCVMSVNTKLHLKKKIKTSLYVVNVSNINSKKNKKYKNKKI